MHHKESNQAVNMKTLEDKSDKLTQFNQTMKSQRESHRSNDLFKNKLIANLLPPQKKVKIPMNPYLMYSPLRPSTSYAVQNQQAQNGFLDYLNGNLNEEELMYIRNFPTLYENMPLPRNRSLKMYIREAKGLPIDDNGSEGKDSQENEDDYFDDNFILRADYSTQKGTILSESTITNPTNNMSQPNISDLIGSSITINIPKTSILHTTQRAAKPINRKASSQNSILNLISERTQDKTFDINTSKSNVSEKKQKIVMFTEPLKIDGSIFCQEQEDPQKRRFQFKRRSVILEQVSLIQNQKQADLKVFQEKQKEIQKKKLIMQHVSKSINSLRNVIQTNVALRKGGTGLVDFQEKEKKENTKFFSNLAYIQADYKNRIENKNLGSANFGNRLEKKGISINKSLKNLSIITSKNMEDNKEQDQDFTSEFNSKKLLYKQYFSENANGFIKVLQDPIDPRMRRKLADSNQAYNKFVQSYIQKVDLVKSKESFQKTGSILKQCHLKDQFKFDGKDFLTLKKDKIERENQFLDQIGDLDKFQDSYMVNSLSKLATGKRIIQEKKVSNANTRQMKVKMMDSQRRKNQSASNLLASSMTKISTENGDNYFDINFNSNSISQSLSKQLKQSQQQQLSAQLSSTQLKSQTVCPSPTNFQISSTPQSSIQLQASKQLKKKENQEKNGYRIIKRNASHQIETGEGNGIFHDESDDSENASRLEANLDMLYSESRSLQSRLSVDNRDGLIRKLKQLMKLEFLNKKVIETNLYKLEKK